MLQFIKHYYIDHQLEQKGASPPHSIRVQKPAVEHALKIKIRL